MLGNLHKFFSKTVFSVCAFFGGGGGEKRGAGARSQWGLSKSAKPFCKVLVCSGPWFLVMKPREIVGVFLGQQLRQKRGEITSTEAHLPEIGVALKASDAWPFSVRRFFFSFRFFSFSDSLWPWCVGLQATHP